MSNNISGGIQFLSGWNTEDKPFYKGNNTFVLSAIETNNGEYIDNAFLMDIAQSHFFTVSLTLSGLVGQNGKPILFNVGEGTYKNFLPVKSIGVNYTGFDNMSVSYSILSDIPVLQRKKTPSISLVCYDLDNDVIERAVNAWTNLCFPENKYVAYIDDIKAIFEYKSYDTKGVLNFTKSLYVIPTGGISVNRDYGENNEKLVTFGVAAIGTYGDSNNSVNSFGYDSSIMKPTPDNYGFK